MTTFWQSFVCREKTLVKRAGSSVHKFLGELAFVHTSIWLNDNRQASLFRTNMPQWACQNTFLCDEPCVLT